MLESLVNKAVGLGTSSTEHLRVTASKITSNVIVSLT